MILLPLHFIISRWIFYLYLLSFYTLKRTKRSCFNWSWFVWLSADNRNRRLSILHFSISQFDLETLMSALSSVAMSKTLTGPATLRLLTTHNPLRTGVTLLHSISPSLKGTSDVVKTQLSSLLIYYSAFCSCSETYFTDKLSLILGLIWYLLIPHINNIGLLYL